MNWLAHVYLSPDNIDSQLGNLIADKIKNQRWVGISANTLLGIQLHKEIDKFTDQHQLFKQSKRRLADIGKLRGVVIDVIYDHLLYKNWSLFSSQTVVDYLSNFYAEANTASITYSSDARAFINTVVQHNLLQYENPEDIIGTLQRIDGRLSPRILRAEKCSDYSEKVNQQLDAIEQDFLEFFPLLRQHVDGIQVR